MYTHYLEFRFYFYDHGLQMVCQTKGQLFTSLLTAVNRLAILKNQKADSESSSSKHVLADDLLLLADCFLNINLDFLIIKI